MSDFYSKITAPIAGNNPFGEDARYDIDFDRLKNEMEKLSDIDLDTVETLSVKILTEKSKDVRAMAWLAYVMMRRNDFARLADMFEVLAYYCQNHFDMVFPTRENAKNAALRWFSESRFIGLCEKTTISAADVPYLTKLVDAITKMKDTLNTRFSDGAPPMSSLYKYATDWKKTAEMAAKAPAVGEKVSDDADNIGSTQHSSQESALGSSVITSTDDGENVIIELTSEQYRELSESIQKINTLLKIQ